MVEAPVSQTDLVGQKDHLNQVQTVDKQSVLSHVRTDPGHHLKATGVPPKSAQQLLSQVRTESKHTELKKAPQVEKQSLLTQVRAEHGGSHLLHETPKIKENVLQQVVPQDSGKVVVPAVAEQSIQYGKNHLHHNDNKTVDKQSVLSQVRHEQGGKNALNHTGVKPKSERDLLSQVRLEGKHTDLNPAQPVEKRSLLAEVRADHGGSHLQETPKLNHQVLQQVVSPDVTVDGSKMTPAVAEQSIQYGKNHLKEKVKTVDKQSVLSEVRHEQGGKNALKHTGVKPKSERDLLSQVRLEAKHTDLNKAQPNEKRSLLAEVRADHGGSHLQETPQLKQEILAQVVPPQVTADGHAKITPAVAEQSLQYGKHHLNDTPIPKETMLREALSERDDDDDDPIQMVPVPAVAEQSLQFGKHHLKESTTVEKQSLWSSVRNQHGGKGHLQPAETVDKQSLLSQVRQGSTEPLAKTETVEKQSLLSQVRQEHGVVQEQLHAVATVEKKSLLSAVRAQHGGGGASLAHQHDAP